MTVFLLQNSAGIKLKYILLLKISALFCSNETQPVCITFCVYPEECRYIMWPTGEMLKQYWEITKSNC